MYRRPSRPLSLPVCLALFVLLSNVTAAGMAGAASVAFPSAQVTVDCDAGDTLADALSTLTFDLVVEFTGTCVESPVWIERDHVELRSDGTGVIEGGVIVIGAQNVHLEGFTVQNEGGIAITEGSSARLVDISSIDSKSIGINVTENSFARLQSPVMERNSFANLSVTSSSRAVVLFSLVANESTNVGIFVGGSSDLRVSVSTMQLDDNAVFGASIEGSSHANFNRFEASGNGSFALRVYHSSSVYAANGFVDDGVKIHGGSSAELQSFILDAGTLSVLENSLARLHNVSINTHDLWVRGSLVQTWMGSVGGNLRLDEDAQLNLNGISYSVGGSVLCHSTAHLYDSPLGGPVCP